MKLFKLTFFVATIFFNAKLCNAQTLHLLQPRESFNKSILDDAPGGDNIVMVKIEYTYYYDAHDGYEYYATLSTLNNNDFRKISSPDDKYFGYFVYNGHLVLVYGDEHIGYFFTKTKIKRKFTFLSLKHDAKSPPIVFEPPYKTYKYKNKKFTKTF